MGINQKNTPIYVAKENERKTENAIRIGRIKEARYDENQLGQAHPDNELRYWHNKDHNGDYRGALYRVEIGDHKTYWIPQLYPRSFNDYEYWAYEVDEQVLVLCLSGDPMQSFIIGAVPYDGARPPPGIDDQSHDKRPWRETVHRRCYKDNYLWEYDRYLHREQRQFPDGTREQLWFEDNREDRTPRHKETNSDKTDVPSRHFHQFDYHGGTQFYFIHDEDIKIHYRHWTFPDSAMLDAYTYDYENLIHTHNHIHADKTSYTYDWQENPQTHRQNWTWENGRTWNYLWDESVPNHIETRTEGDGLSYTWQWHEANQTHHQNWTWPDGRVWNYLWDEAAQNHIETLAMGDGISYTLQWDEAAQQHLRNWDFPDGYNDKYHWNEAGGTHTRSETMADGTVMKYVYDEGGNSHLFEIAFSDGTVIRHHYNSPHKTEINWPDGGSVSYDVATGDLQATVMRDAMLVVQRDLRVDVTDNATVNAGKAITTTAGEKATVKAPSIVLEGNVEIKGNLNVSGDVKVVKEVTAKHFYDSSSPSSINTI